MVERAQYRGILYKCSNATGTSRKNKVRFKKDFLTKFYPFVLKMWVRPSHECDPNMRLLYGILYGRGILLPIHPFYVTSQCQSAMQTGAMQHPREQKTFGVGGAAQETEGLEGGGGEASAMNRRGSMLVHLHSPLQSTFSSHGLGKPAIVSILYFLSA